MAVAIAAMPATAPAQDCIAEGQAYSNAYKAYNDCSAAGRGGCGGETTAYDSARERFEECHARRRGPPPAWTAAPPERDEDRRDWGRGDFDLEEWRERAPPSTYRPAPEPSRPRRAR